MPTTKAKLCGDPYWFHMFRDMITSGDWAKLSASAAKVYPVIKCHSNHTSGKSFPTIETIAGLSGISESQVKRVLIELTELGYLTVNKVGRKNTYILREKINITNTDGTPLATASFDYVPNTVKPSTADLKHVLLSGQLGDAKIVHIERLTVNIANDQAQQIILNVSDLSSLPKKLLDKLMAMRTARSPATTPTDASQATLFDPPADPENAG